MDNILELLPRFTLNINESDDNDTGVELISFVERPAIEIDFVALNGTLNYEFKVADKKKQFLTGPALIPNKLIYREYQGMPYTILFTIETIEAIVKKFFRTNKIFNTNEEHSEKLENNYIIESWIINDDKNDKAISLGFKGLPNGTWMVTYHIQDKEYWDSKVESGEIKGFSVEGFFNHIESSEEFKSYLKEYKKEEKLKNNKKGKIMNIKKILGLVSKDKKDIKVNMAEYISSEGVKIFIDDETLAVSIISTDESGEEVMTPFEGSAEILVEDGSTLVIVDGILVEIKAPSEEEVDMAEYTSSEGVKVFVSDEDSAVFVSEVSEDGTETFVAFEGDGEILLEDGRTLVIVAGFLTEIKDAEEVAIEEGPSVDEMLSKLSKTNISNKVSIKNLNKELESLKKVVASLTIKLAKISKEPAGDVINTKSLEDITLSKGYNDLSEKMKTILSLSNRKK